MAAEKTPGGRWLPRIAAAVLLSAAAATVASPAAAAQHSLAATSAHHPPGYQIISSGLIGAVPGAFNSGAFATCPAGTVVWGGGVAFSGSADASLTVSTSNPNGSGGWAARVNNTGTTTAQFEVAAICASKPKGYQIVSQMADNPPGTQSHATAACPSPDVLLGGGTLSTADQVGAILTSAWPRSSAKFTGYLYNGTTSDANFIVYAICGHKPAGYKIASISGSVGPSGTLEDGIACPAGTSTLDGGAQSPDHVPAVQVSGSIDQGSSGWTIALNNTGQSAEQADGYVICAA
ncbi:MAG: hypothetical protein ABSA03_07335 [Streptosporangiaceae bacterium]|jgi:hypothetical protein